MRIIVAASFIGLAGLAPLHAASPVVANFRKADDIVIASDTYRVAGKSFDLSLTFAPQTGAQLCIINNTGLGFIDGTFENLPHGGEVTLKHGGTDYRFVADYFGGDGNDLMLTWAENRIYVWGDNEQGQLCDPTIKYGVEHPVPVRSELLKGRTILSVATFRHQYLALCSDGTLVHWGRAPEIVVTKGTPLEGKRVIKIFAGYSKFYCLTSDGNIVEFVTGLVKPNKYWQIDRSGVLKDKAVVNIFAAVDQTFAVCSDGSLVAWENSHRADKLPIPKLVDFSGSILEGKKITQLATGVNRHHIVLCTDGTLAAWGHNGVGQLGIGTKTKEERPTAVAVKGSPLEGKRVVSISAGTFASYALCSDGTMAGWGHLFFGQPGNLRNFHLVPTLLNFQGTHLEGNQPAQLLPYFVHGVVRCENGDLVKWKFEFPESLSGHLGEGEKAVRLASCADRQAVAIVAMPLKNPDGIRQIHVGPKLPADSPRGVAFPKIVPAGAKLSVEFAQPEYFLGESVPMNVVLENTGERSFQFQKDAALSFNAEIDMDGYQVRVTDQNGNILKSALIKPSAFSRFMQPPTWLKPAAKATHQLELMKFVRIVEPGTYTVEVSNSFSWKTDERNPAPVARGKVTFKSPDARQARLIAQKYVKASPNIGLEVGTSMLADSIYFEPLLELAKAGELKAIPGLGASFSKQATPALMELADGDSELAYTAAIALLSRVPVNVPRLYQPPRPNESWDDAFGEKLNALALKCIAKPDPKWSSIGANLLQVAGKPEHAPMVISALDRALGQSPAMNPRIKTGDNVLDYPQPIQPLVEVMKVLRERGYALPENLSGDGQIFLFFEFLIKSPEPRPERWLNHLKAWGDTTKHPTAMAALRSIPEPMPADVRDFVLASLQREDPGICRVACEVAGKSGDKTFAAPIIAILHAESERWLFQTALQSALKLGERYEVLYAAANRMAEQELFHEISTFLRDNVVSDIPKNISSGKPNNRENRVISRAAWIAFLTAHKAEISEGKRFAYSDPAFPAAELIGSPPKPDLNDPNLPRGEAH